MSQPAFVPERHEIWFTDGTSGFYALKVTNGVWPFVKRASVLGQTTQTPAAHAPRNDGSTTMPATGRRTSATEALALVLLLAALALRHQRRRAQVSSTTSAVVSRRAGRPGGR